jgi:hypothetical protein
VELFIYGTITEQDAQALEALSPEFKQSSFPWLKIDSTGGFVEAAMKIGRLVRKYEGFTSIEKEQLLYNANCYSSCALIFIAGVRRSIVSLGGQLGLHRPYLASTPEDRQAVEKQITLMLSNVKQYIAEMGITDNFCQQMVNTESSRMVFYGNPTAAHLIESYRALGIRNTTDDWTKLVPEYDPVYQEIQISYEARSRGVTMFEMRRRELDAEVCLKREGSDWSGCREALLWGLTEPVYRERTKQTSQCWVDDDTAILQAIPIRERQDHPLWMKKEACIRKVMLGDR